MEKKLLRLNKLLQERGAASRRGADILIELGEVTVNGRVVTELGLQVDPLTDVITVEGKELGNKEPKVYFMLNKPLDYICSNLRQTRREKLVIDLFEHLELRLFTVGRLDQETSGLIIVTNDGDFSNKVIHPSSNIEKEYLVVVEERITEEHLNDLRIGAVVEYTQVTPVSVTRLRDRAVRIVVKEGKKREIRHIVANAGLTLLSLKRTRIGGLLLGKLPEGLFRPLSEADRESIFDCATTSV